MSTEVTTGLFALGGVIVGGLVTTGVELFLRSRQDGHLRRLAARVMHAALSSFQASLLAAIENTGDARPYRTGEAVLAAWHEHQAALSSLSWADWRLVEVAVDGVATFPWSGPLAPEDWSGVEGSFRTLVGSIDKALAVPRDVE